MSSNLLHEPVLWILIAASLVSWAIILDRLLVLVRTTLADQAFLRGQQAPSAPLAQLQDEFENHAGAGREHIATLMDGAITHQRHRLDRALSLLGAIGSTAPYVGLLGTVIGIIQAFQAIQVQRNMSPDIVAGGISAALVATAAGLAVAIPAVVAHHLFISAINRRTAKWEAVVAEWLPDEAAERQDERVRV
ncbi:MAG: MotA/TolQ/ExbB proton channel family protein [Armatimonadota bacterium]